MKNSTPTWKPTHLINLAVSDFLSKRLTWRTDWEISCMINCGLIRRRTIYQMNDWLNGTLTHPLTLWWMAPSFDWLTDTVSNKLIRLDNNHQSITKLKFGAFALLLCLRRTFCVLRLVWHQPKLFCFTSPAMRQLTHHFTDNQTHCLTDQLLLLTHRLADTHWSATHLINNSTRTGWHSLIR